MSCQELTEVLTDYMERQLTDAEAAWTEEHLAQCDACRAYLDQLRQMVAALRSLGATESAEPAQLERIFAAMR
ncbi:hypothetical protein BH24ACT23_BH24ACT23_08670 [soil metagenome]